MLPFDCCIAAVAGTLAAVGGLQDLACRVTAAFGLVGGCLPSAWLA